MARLKLLNLAASLIELSVLSIYVAGCQFESIKSTTATAQTITFATPATQTVGTPLALSATTSSGLAVSFASATASVCTVSGTTATFLAAGTCTISASQAGDSTYAAAAPIIDSFTVNVVAKTAQTITFAAPATQTVGTPLALSATASSGLAVSFASTTTSVCTVSGTTATFLAAGTCAISASQAGDSIYAAATSVTDSFTVNPAAQTIAFATPAAQTVGTPLALSAAASSGLAISFASTTAGVCTVSGGTATFLTAGTCSITASQAGNSTYAAAASVTDNFTVNAAAKTAQTVTFPTPATQTVGTPLALSATASSGLAVSFASTTAGVCTVSGGTATFLTAGTCSITASQAGNSTYATATPITASFTVNAAAKTAQTVTFPTPATQTVGTPLALSATASSGLAVSFASTTAGVCTVSGGTATFLTAGTCSITASQAGNSTYATATPITASFTVNAAAKAAQTITFPTPAAQTVGIQSTLSATASSGLAVSFTSTTTSVCTVSGTTTTFLTPGTCSITASQPGDSIYAAATSITDSFTVNQAAQTITFPTPATQTVGIQSTLSATTSSGLAVSFASTTTSVCTVSGTTATFLTAGTCSITASQAGNSTYATATPITASFNVNAAAKTAQTITFPTPATQTVGTPLALSATATSGLAVSFASTTTSVCTVSGAMATFLTPGTCSVTASQPGNSTYAAATSVTAIFTVNAAAKMAQTITFATPATQTVGTPLTLSATASSTLAVSFASTTTSVCTVSGTTATFLTPGTCSITASQPGNSTYAAATPIIASFTVNAAAKTAQTITFATPATQTVGTPLPLSATATSGLAVSFASTTPGVCTVSGATATFLTAGTCSITASQPGNSIYAAATSITDSFTVNQAAQTITFPTPAEQTVGIQSTLSATASSGLAVSFTSTATSVCTVSGTTATFLIAGTCTITASQPGNSTYAAATPVTDSFTVDAATTGSGLPPLPAMSNVQAQVSGNTVNITFDPVDGAQDYRAYVMPEDSDIVVSGGSLVGIKNAIYRCAGLRAVPPVQPAQDTINATNTFGQGSGNDSFTQTWIAPYAIQFGPSYTRVSADDTLGYVFTTSQPNTAAVYEVGDPAALSDHYADGIRLKQTREKLYLQDFSAYQAKVAAGWRDDGVVFYAPTSASACGGGKLTPVNEIETTQTNPNILYRWYYSSASEVAAWNTVNTTVVSIPQNVPFSVCSTQAANSQPLMRVNYSFPTGENAHDELAVGKSRYDLARCQGTTTGSCANVASRSLWSIRYSGVAAPTQLVVEALDQGCPYPGGLWGTEPVASSLDPIIATGPYPTPVDNFTDPIYTLAQIQQASPAGLGEAYLNGEFDLVPNSLDEAAGTPFVTNGTPHPIARAVLNVAPQTRPAMDFSSNFQNPETFTEVFTDIYGGSPVPDCGLIEAFPPLGDIQGVFPFDEAVGCQATYQLTSPTYDVLVLGGESPETVGMAQGEYITSGGGMVWTAPLNPPPASISSTDNTEFLHAVLEGNGYTTDRRYPQIIISDHWEGTPGNTTTPVQDVPPTFMTTQWYMLDAKLNDPSGNPFPDGDLQNTLFLSALDSTGPNLLIELCSNRGWAVNAQCPYFLLERSGASLVPDPNSTTGALIHPQTSNAFPDINDVMQEDTAIRWDLYVSKNRAYLYTNSKAYGCADTTTVAGINPGDNTPHIPTGSVSVSFGDRLYHPEAETGELCATNSFLCRHSNFETSRRYDYFGYSSNQRVALNSSGQFNSGSDGTTATWDESVIPCNSVIFDNNQDGGTLNPEQ